MTNRAGKLVSNLSGEMAYESFRPSSLPPNPEDMLTAMSELEKYINSDDDLDPLVQADLIHYRFETTPPFLDGNGRVGRLIITIFLIEKCVLFTLAFYISYYLKMNRIESYDTGTTYW